MQKSIEDSRIRIGHIHLTVSDLEKSKAFYCDLLGFSVNQRGPGVVFLSTGGYHHDIGLNIWSRPGAKKPQEGQIGLYHFAILYPSRKKLAEVLDRLRKANYSLDGVADHGVSEALYLKDPDGNGLELYFDRPEKDWPRDKEGNLVMVTKALDIDSLLAEH